MAKILVADDEELIRKLINDCLSKAGHEILEASDGLEALNIFRKNADIEMALLDIMMPEIDGWEVCRKIRETSSIPVVLVSARSQDFDQIMGFESGADDYVTKPFSLTMRMISLLIFSCFCFITISFTIRLQKFIISIAENISCTLRWMVASFSPETFFISCCVMETASVYSSWKAAGCVPLCVLYSQLRWKMSLHWWHCIARAH